LLICDIDLIYSQQEEEDDDDILHQIVTQVENRIKKPTQVCMF
jgi:hypothetical protein